MIKQIIDEKIRQHQKLKEKYERLLQINYPYLSYESIISLINKAINDLETIRFLYLHELKDKENIKND